MGGLCNRQSASDERCPLQLFPRARGCCPLQRTEEDRHGYIEDSDRVEPHLSIPQQLQGLSMVNAGPLYCSPDKRVILDAVCKYQARGIRYIRCKDYHGVKNTCKVSTRTLTDSAMMHMNIHGLPSTSQTFLDVFWQFGILDLQWILGGMPCGLESAFCRPRVEVIEEESYESYRKVTLVVTMGITCEYAGRMC